MNRWQEPEPERKRGDRAKGEAMEREQIKETVTELIRNIIDDDTVEIKEESGLMEDLELSSLEIMTMIADIEQEYQIVLEEAELRSMVSVGDMVEGICKKVGCEG